MQPAGSPPALTPPKPLPAPPPRRMSFRALLWIAILIAFAFVLGYGPKEWERRQLATTLQQTQLDLRLADLHRQLGMANFEAQRNNYANATAAARVFFDGCRSVLQEFELDDRPRTKLALQAYASSSDTVLVQLGNADPMAKEQLSSLFFTMNGVIERRQ